MPPLIDREEEKARIRELAGAPPSLIVLRGRRRVGKSFLLSHALPGERLVSYQADEQGRVDQLELLAREASRLVPGGAPLSFADWC